MIHLRATPYRAVENAISGGVCPTFGDTGSSFLSIEQLEGRYR
jgi:hypothetical protein